MESPEALERRHVLADGRSVIVRPIRAADEAATRIFFQRLQPERLLPRLMRLARRLNHRLRRPFARAEPQRRRMTLVCETVVAGEPRLAGEARFAAVPDSRRCTFGIAVADGWQASGVAGLLMTALMEQARADGFEAMETSIPRANHGMLRFLRRLGFEVRSIAGEPTLFQLSHPLARYARAGSSPN